MAIGSRPSTGRPTHAVTNQPPPLEDVNLFATHLPLVEALEREGAGWAGARALDVGAAWGAEPLRWGFAANEHPPRLRTHDRYGHRIDEVEFHPAWHRLMALASEHELHSLPWTTIEAGGHVARAALYLTATQAEAGFACPITMTFAAVPALRTEPAVAAEWEPLLMARGYDGALGPAGAKGSAKCGMAMTEKQGGSDVRANTTVARAVGDGEYLLTGHKWFCSAPMCDLFLVLAQTAAGLSCFALPRILPDGGRNAFHLQRLKDKLGNRSNASAEIELDGAWARSVGEPGRGVATILEMVGHTRLDCVIGSAAGLECLGGNGYVEESGMPRLYREAPLNSVWEGSGNVNALDVLRAIARQPPVLDAFLTEIDLAAGADARLDAFTARLRADLARSDGLEARARRLVEDLALALQGSLLVRHAPPAVADAFCASRLAGDCGYAFGTLPAGVDTAAIVARHTPHLA